MDYFDDDNAQYWDQSGVTALDFEAGVVARKNGLPMDSCPYANHRKLPWEAGWCDQDMLEKQESAAADDHET